MPYAARSTPLRTSRCGIPFPQRDVPRRSSILDDVVGSGDIELLAATLELSACVAADLGDGLRAARLEAPQKNIREKAGMPIAQPDAALLERFLAPMRATIPRGGPGR